MKGWHFIAADLTEVWIGLWVDELVGWPARYEEWLRS